MTVPSGNNRRSDNTGNGATAEYSFNFRILDDDDLVVSVEDTDGVITRLTKTTDYAVTGVGLYAGGSITLVDSGQAWLDGDGELLTDYKLTIRGKPVLAQPYDAKNRGGFYPEDHEKVFDRLTQLIFAQQDELDRSIRFPETDGVAINNVLPPASLRASKFLACDANGGVIASSGGIDPAIPVSVYGESLISAASAAAARSVLGFSQAALPAANAAFGVPLNFRMTDSVASNALTMAVKGVDGNDPSAANPVYVPFRTSTGVPYWRTLTGALSGTVSSGSTLGHNSGLKQYIYRYLLDNGGALKVAFSSKFFGWHGIVSTTAEGGAGAADSGTVMYADAAYSNVPFVCVAYSDDTQATAGTWATTPTLHPAPFTHPLISFAAHKNGSAQGSVVTGTDTLVTFGTELYDNGGLFDAATNYRWVPPPGFVDELTAQVFMDGVLADQAEIDAQVWKNGVVFRIARVRCSGTGSLPARVSIQDECNGTDYYDVRVRHATGGDEQINGLAIHTYVFGRWSPYRS